MPDHDGLKPETPAGNGEMKKSQHVGDLYGNWFLDYASYVILERAVPALFDGLKPVQRRILHAMKEMDDGRFNKAANVIGQTMQFHPHGDAAIGDAMVNLGQKELLLDTQGNWGDIRTGDSAAAPRYIEARLSKFALEVVFNADTTEWQLSYDGRKKEPVHLPVKFPLVLAQGAEGIAVGLATRIMPHNFNELIEASIDILEGRPVSIVPDFPTGGMADFSNYNEGLRGGRIRMRAHIEASDRRTLVIRDIPYGVTTSSLMDSIVKANDNGKIKIKRVIDNTAQNVEIIVELPGGVSPEVSIDALYAFTDCEVSISPNACVIIDDKPHFLGVNEILRISTRNTLGLLKRELEIRSHELAEKWHFASLEKIFIEKRIYRDIEECETWEAVLEAIENGLEPYRGLFRREITRDDIIRLTEIKIKRISRYDSFKADEAIRALEDEMDEVANNLAHLVEYAVAYFRTLKKKYGTGRERRTEIRSFDTIEVTQVAAANEKLYVNREEGFIGYGLKKDEYVSDCSDLDDIIVFLENGTFQVTKVADKSFVGKNIIHVAVWNRNDDRTIYNMIYRDGTSGASYTKRFAVTSVTRDRLYDLTQGTAGTKVLYFTANPNGEAEVVTIHLSSRCRARIKVFDFDFADQAIKNRGAKGNRLSRYPVQRVVQKSAGTTTLGELEIWYDPAVGRLNTDGRGRSLGTFEGEDLILAVDRQGTYELTSYELTNRYDPERSLVIEKYDPDTVITAVHYDGEKENYYVKRFQVETRTVGKRFRFIGDDEASRLVLATTAPEPRAEMHYLKGRAREHLSETCALAELVEIKGWKARGNRLSTYRVVGVDLLAAGGEEEDGPATVTGEGNGETMTATPSPGATAAASTPAKRPGSPAAVDDDRPATEPVDDGAGEPAGSEGSQPRQRSLFGNGDE